MSKKAIAAAIAQAQAGVDYSPKTGATCPCCGADHASVYKTMPWVGSMRVRYHKCQTNSCLISKIGAGIKSIEVYHD